eukprot:scaffold4357_cov113-Isochrysis_galbana.AAC.17
MSASAAAAWLVGDGGPKPGGMPGGMPDGGLPVACRGKRGVPGSELVSSESPYLGVSCCCGCSRGVRPVPRTAAPIPLIDLTPSEYGLPELGRSLPPEAFTSSLEALRWLADLSGRGHGRHGQVAAQRRQIRPGGGRARWTTPRSSRLRGHRSGRTRECSRLPRLTRPTHLLGCFVRAEVFATFRPAACTAATALITPRDKCSPLLPPLAPCSASLTSPSDEDAEERFGRCDFRPPLRDDDRFSPIDTILLPTELAVFANMAVALPIRPPRGVLTSAGAAMPWTSLRAAHFCGAVGTRLRPCRRIRAPPE